MKVAKSSVACGRSLAVAGIISVTIICSVGWISYAAKQRQALHPKTTSIAHHEMDSYVRKEFPNEPIPAQAAVGGAPEHDDWVQGLATVAKRPRTSERSSSKQNPLKHGANVNAAQPDGITSLHWAAYRDDEEAANRLIRSGANVNEANDLGVTPLWLACSNGSVAMIQSLLKAGANPNIALSSGETPLMTASRVGSADGVKLLLTYGANPNAKEHLREQTALMWAVAQQHPDVVRVLIEHGSDVRARSLVRRQVINTAGNQDPRGVMEVEEGGFTPLLFAARQGDLESTRLLLAAGADVNDVAPAGTSALVVAAHSGHGALAAFLLDQGADPNADGAGYTALHAAILRGDLQLVKQLLAHGADPNARLVKGTPTRRSDNRGFFLYNSWVGATPFWLAAKFAEPDIMRVLAAGGADPLFKKDGVTALMVSIATEKFTALAAKNDRHGRLLGITNAKPPDEDERITLNAVKAALDLGIDINAADEDGNTPLHSAAALGLKTVVQFLVEKGAELNAKNKRGETPLQAAVRSNSEVIGGDPEIKSTVDLLRKLGAKE